MSDADLNFVRPAAVVNELAVYDRGAGEPVLLMPYPHGFTTSPMACSALAELLLDLGRHVLTFDPPGAYRSSRPARVDMPEMLACAVETLHVAGVPGPLDVVGHSMGGLVALAFALNHPDHVRRLILVGSLSGGPALRRCRAMPWNWSPLDSNFWRYVWWGMRLRLGWASLAVHKRLANLIWQASYVDPSLAPRMVVHPGDESQPPPVRDRWPREALRLDYSARLQEIRAQTLVCVGRHDPQTPVACSQELARIPRARLVIFENSGHNPFVEERTRFARVLSDWLGPDVR